MSRGRHDDATLDMFRVPVPAAPLPGSADYRPVVAHLVSVALKEAHGDRHQVAADMSRLTGAEISKYMLDAYSSEGRETFNLPFWLAPALEVSCRTHDLSAWLVGVRGARMSIGRDALSAELGKLEQKRIELDQMIREMKTRMRDI